MPLIKPLTGKAQDEYQRSAGHLFVPPDPLSRRANPPGSGPRRLTCTHTTGSLALGRPCPGVRGREQCGASAGPQAACILQGGAAPLGPLAPVTARPSPLRPGVGLPGLLQYPLWFSSNLTQTFVTGPSLNSSQLALYERACASCQALTQLVPESYLSRHRNTAWEGNQRSINLLDVSYKEVLLHLASLRFAGREAKVFSFPIF